MLTHVPPDLPASTPCKLAFVGEAPSDEELMSGIPLVGPSGRIFNAMLRVADLDRDEFLVTNVFDEKLPGNSVAPWCAPAIEARAGGFSNLPPLSCGFLRPEFHHHLERLRAEIEAAQPTVIVPLGGTALWAFTGSDTIGDARGTAFPARYVSPGTKLFPTFHPAFVMKQWKYYTVVAQDFMKAMREAESGPEVFYPKRTFLIEPTLADLSAYLPRLLASDLVSVDIETGWGFLTDIGFGEDAEHAINVPFVDRRKPSRSYWPDIETEARAWEFVRAVLESEVPKLGQFYGTYDVFWLWDKYGIRTINMREDTRLLHHALFPELPKDLKFMGASYTRQGPWKSMRQHTKEKRDD